MLRCRSLCCFNCSDCDAVCHFSIDGSAQTPFFFSAGARGLALEYESSSPCRQPPSTSSLADVVSVTPTVSEGAAGLRVQPRRFRIRSVLHPLTCDLKQDVVVYMIHAVLRGRQPGRGVVDSVESQSLSERSSFWGLVCTS